MKCLIKQVKIVGTRSAFDGATLDIGIDAYGNIEEINPKIEKNADIVYDFDGAFLSFGWMDVGAHGCDPGLESQEDFESLSKAASYGGFTALAILPNTKPSIHSKSEVLYVKNRTKDLLQDIYPIGAISVNCEGKDIAEMMDMFHEGAVAFSDGLHPVQHGGLLMRALLYAKAFNGLVMNQPMDNTISKNGQINEGLVSTSLGMPGIPGIAEELMVQRDLSLLEYTGSKLHLLNVTSSGSLEKIRAARERGLLITASVPAINLLLDDSALFGFDSHLKVLPPLRGNADITALKAGLKDGTLDFITSNHQPQESDHKRVEFPYAAFGALGLQTAFANSLEALEKVMSVQQLVEKWSISNRVIMGLPVPKLEVGSKANFTIFDPAASWEFDPKYIQSKSINSPFVGKQLKTKVLGVINGNQSIKLNY